MTRVGIIGFGGAGQAHHFYFSCIAGCRVTKILDPKPAAAERAALRAPDARLCTRRAVVLARPRRRRRLHTRLDARSLRRRSAGAGAERARGEAARRLGRRPSGHSPGGGRGAVSTVAVVHQMRFVPLHRRIKGLVDANVLGALSYLEGYYVHDLTTRAFVHDCWRETDNATPLVDSGCHFVDLLRWLAGEEIVEVFAAAGHRAFPEYPESDLNVVILRFASGVVGQVVVAFGEPGPQDHTVRVAGRDATVRDNLLYRRDGRLGEVLHRPMIIQRKLLRGNGKTGGQTLYRQLRTNVPPYLFARASETMRLLARRPGAEYGAAHYPVRLYEHSLACVEAIEDFLGAIRDRRPPLCSVDEAGRTVLACLAGVESYRTNRPVKVPELDA